MKTRVQITPIGLVFFWGGMGLLIVGAIQFSGTLILLGVSGIFVLGVARVMAVRNVRAPGMRLIRDWPRSGFSGEPFPGRTVVDSGETVRYGLIVEDRMAALEAEPLIFRHIAGREEKTKTCLVRGRGVVRSGEVEIRSSFPLRCWSVSSPRRFDESGEMILWPRPLLPIDVESVLERAVTDGIEKFESSSSMPGASLDLHGIRGYQSGDSVHAIHWPASSRGQGMMVREYERPVSRPTHFGLILHSYVPPGEILQPDRFEQSLRLACGIVCWCDERGVDLTIDWLIETPEAPPLTRLALAGRREVSLEEVERAIDEAGTACDLVWVVGDRALARETSEARVCWIDPESSIR